MSSKIRFDVLEGKMKGKAFLFEEHDTFLFGRDHECHCCLPDDRRVSRHHFLLEVNPPVARLRDLGSLNGTHVNGKKCGGRQPGETPEQGARHQYPEVDLKHGDEVEAGDTVMKFTVELDGAPHRAGSSQVREDIARLLFDLDEKKRAEAQHLIQRQIGTYALQKEIGRGGFGAVYLARRDGQHEAFAVKVMLPRIDAGGSAINKFLREVQSTSSLSHPNIVQIFDFGTSRGIFFLAMEFCDGGSVDQLMLAHGGKLPLAICKPIMLHTLEALQYAHAKGFVHRDLKPSNILLCFSKKDVTAKIADFGLAKLFEQAGLSGLTLTGNWGGSPHFMAREQVVNFKYVKPTSDIWSIGATFYAMLTGCLPRDYSPGRDPLQVVLQEAPVPLLQRNSEVPTKIASVIDKALADNVHHRYASAEEMRNALLRALGNS
ncbi:MAG: protein kinase [Verrucomicrobia bacterium]|nr:protein kinase [Verrucomicrobiota bacterium]